MEYLEVMESMASKDTIIVTQMKILFLGDGLPEEELEKGKLLTA